MCQLLSSKFTKSKLSYAASLYACLPALPKCVRIEVNSNIMQPHRFILISYRFLILPVPSVFFVCCFCILKITSEMTGGLINVFIVVFFPLHFQLPPVQPIPPFHHSPLSITASSFTISALPTWQMAGLLCPLCYSSVETTSVIISQAELDPKHQCGSDRALCLDLNYRPSSQNSA